VNSGCERRLKRGRSVLEVIVRSASSFDRPAHLCEPVASAVPWHLSRRAPSDNERHRRGGEQPEREVDADHLESS
jgi:hypothetical protein